MKTLPANCLSCLRREKDSIPNETSSRRQGLLPDGTSTIAPAHSGSNGTGTTTGEKRS